MTTRPEEAERRMMSGLLDVLIRAGLIAAMVVLCYQVFAPFLHLTIWAIILAVALYPFHQTIARRIGGRQGLSSTLILLLGAVLIIAPTAVLMVLLGDSVHHLIQSVQSNTLKIPPPRPSVAAWPVVGEKIHSFWALAHTDLPALIQSLQPKIGDLAKGALAFVASIGGALLGLIAAFIIAAIIMAFGAAAIRGSRAIFERIVGLERAGRFVNLSTATIRAVALGVIGVALIQAIIIGMALFIARVPLAGVAAAIMLVLGIAQVPALLVTLPAIAYIWMSGEYGTIEGVAFTIGLVLAGMADNVLKPLLLGRGVDAPMPVILLGALGGMATAGILGMFVGATLLALGYQIFMLWVADRHDSGPAEASEASGAAPDSAAASVREAASAPMTQREATPRQ
jgi:predicted PurR-regulated permease PerM